MPNFTALRAAVFPLSTKNLRGGGYPPPVGARAIVPLLQYWLQEYLRRRQGRGIVDWLSYGVENINASEKRVLCCLPGARRDFHARRDLQASTVFQS